MKLRDLGARFLKIKDPTTHAYVDELAGADGIMFRCPRPTCGHYVFCWFSHVGQHVSPNPGRWKPQGTGLDDLTFVPWEGHSQSVRLTSGCVTSPFSTRPCHMIV